MQVQARSKEFLGNKDNINKKIFLEKLTVTMILHDKYGWLKTKDWQ